jgi:hypothetical protein
MNILGKFEIFIVDTYAVPHTVAHVVVWKLVKDPITTQDDEIVIFIDFKWVNIRFANNDIWVAATEFKFSFWISEGSWNRKSAR